MCACDKISATLLLYMQSVLKKLHSKISCKYKQLTTFEYHIGLKIFMLKEKIGLLNVCGLFNPQILFLKVNSYNMDEWVERPWHLVYYQASGQLGITGCGHVYLLIH